MQTNILYSCEKHMKLRYAFNHIVHLQDDDDDGTLLLEQNLSFEQGKFPTSYKAAVITDDK